MRKQEHTRLAELEAQKHNQEFIQARADIVSGFFFSSIHVLKTLVQIIFGLFTFVVCLFEIVL